MEEIWEDIIGYEGRYQISTLGRIKSYDKHLRGVHNCKRFIKGKICKLTHNKKKYTVVNLYDSASNPKTFLVHRLVAIQYIINSDDQPCINHKNGVKDDNRVENLEWCTPLENTYHAITTGLMDLKIWRDRMSNRLRGQTSMAAKIVLNTETGVFFYSVLEASKAHNIPYSRFSHKLCGRAVNNTPFIQC